MGTTAGRRPRDAQRTPSCTWPRRRCRRARCPASTPARASSTGSSGTLWWHERFPDRELGHVPRLRPGQRRPAGVLPRGGHRPHHHPSPALPHEGRGAARAHALGARHRLRAAASRSHVRPRAARRGRRVLRRRARGGARGVVPGARRARRPSAAARSRRPAPLRLGRTAPRSTRARTGLRRRSWTVDDEEHELQGCFDGYERGSSVAAVLAAFDGQLVRIPTEVGVGGRAMSAEGTRRAIVAAFLANLGIAISKFAAFAITGSASMLAEAIHSVADTGNQGLLFLGGKQRPQGAHRGAPVRLRPRALLLGVHRGAGAVHPRRRCSRSYEGIEKLHRTPSTSTRRSGRSPCSASPSCSRAGRCAPHVARPADRERRTVVVAVHPHHQEPRAPGRAARGQRRARRPAVRAGRHQPGRDHRQPALGCARQHRHRSAARRDRGGPGDRDEEPADRRSRRPGGRRTDPHRDPRRPRGRAHHPSAHAAPRSRRRAASPPSSSSTAPRSPRSARAIDTVEARVRASVPIGQTHLLRARPLPEPPQTRTPSRPRTRRDLSRPTRSTMPDTAAAVDTLQRSVQPSRRRRGDGGDDRRLRVREHVTAERPAPRGSGAVPRRGRSSSPRHPTRTSTPRT